MYIDNHGRLCDDDYLAHHGILGQKWGIRRFQPYPAGHIGGRFIGVNRNKDEESRLRKEADHQLKKYHKAKEKIAKLENRLTKRYFKGKVPEDMFSLPLKEAVKYSDYINKNKRLMQLYKKRSDAERAHMELENKLEDKLESDKQAQYERFVKNSMYSEEERKEAMNSARKSDRYDINFLETVQNDSFSGEKHYNRQKMLSEYSKYLKNPAEYMTTHESDNGLEYDDEAASNTVYGGKQKSQKDYDNAYEKAEDAYKKVMWKGSTEKEIKKAWNNREKARIAAENNNAKESRRLAAKVRANNPGIANRAKAMLRSARSYAEIAKALGIPEGSVWALVHDE